MSTSLIILLLVQLVCHALLLLLCRTVIKLMNAVDQLIIKYVAVILQRNK